MTPEEADTFLRGFQATVSIPEGMTVEEVNAAGDKASADRAADRAFAHTFDIAIADRAAARAAATTAQED